MSGGKIDIYSGGVITDFNIDAVTDVTDRFSGSLRISVSSDGKEWVPVKPVGYETCSPQNASWGNVSGKRFYSTLKASSNIHYIRIVYASSAPYLNSLPAVKSISYNYVSVEDSCDGMSETYEKTVTANNASEITPYVEGSEYKIGNKAEINGYYAFFKDDAWQQGEIVFSSEKAITKYRIDAWSGNAANYGMLKFYASSDGENYTVISPEKYAHSNKSGWGELKGNYFYGKLLASADIHYIKVEYVKCGEWVKTAPAVKEISYNIADCCNNGHDKHTIVKTVEATRTEDGYTVYKCSHCDTTYTVVDEGSRFLWIDKDAADLDNDGSITATDLAILKKKLLNGESADINGDGNTDILDLIRLKKYLASVTEGPVINTGASTDSSDNMD